MLPTSSASHVTSGMLEARWHCSANRLNFSALPLKRLRGGKSGADIKARTGIQGGRDQPGCLVRSRRVVFMYDAPLVIDLA